MEPRRRSKGHLYYLRKGAEEIRSLESERWIYLFRFHSSGDIKVFMRHTNGNRATIIISESCCKVLINGELKTLHA